MHNMYVKQSLTSQSFVRLIIEIFNYIVTFPFKLLLSTFGAIVYFDIVFYPVE